MKLLLHKFTNLQQDINHIVLDLIHLTDFTARQQQQSYPNGSRTMESMLDNVLQAAIKVRQTGMQILLKRLLIRHSVMLNNDLLSEQVRTLNKYLKILVNSISALV